MWVRKFELSYFKSEEHFKNYIKKIIKSNTEYLDSGDLFALDVYVNYVYNNKFEKQFTWDIRSNPKLLKKKNMLSWLSACGAAGVGQLFRYSDSDIDCKITDEFKELLLDLQDVPGVYSFWLGDDLMYIGMSINLQSRILCSFNERFRNNTDPIYLKYIRTAGGSDAAILEAYFIGKLNPALNGTANYDDVVTLRIVEEPAFSEPVRCNVSDVGSE